MTSDGEDGECAVVLIMRCVLCGIDFKVIVDFIGIHRDTGDIDIRLLSHVVILCRNKLENQN
jgi:hypothetical protein